MEMADDSTLFYDFISLSVGFYCISNFDLMGVQEFIVLVLLAGAIGYLVLRFTKKKTGCGDDCDCHQKRSIMSSTLSLSGI